MKIPKIIFQKSKKSIPDSNQVRQIISKCNGWTYIHYDNKQAIQFFNDNYVEEFKDIIDKFNKMPTGAHGADLFRYYHLWITGGVFIDDDAMIKINIENIVKDYEFFSVKSSYVPNAIFQGFIGATAKNDIIYRTLKDAYNINIDSLSECYFLLCYNLNNIINSFGKNYHLYSEGYYDDGCAKCLNDDGEIILLHYYKHKIIPYEYIKD